MGAEIPAPIAILLRLYLIGKITARDLLLQKYKFNLPARREPPSHTSTYFVALNIQHKR